jgi:hypothetical protein
MKENIHNIHLWYDDNNVCWFACASYINTERMSVGITRDGQSPAEALMMLLDAAEISGYLPANDSNVTRRYEIRIKDEV